MINFHFLFHFLFIPIVKFLIKSIKFNFRLIVYLKLNVKLLVYYYENMDIVGELVDCKIMFVSMFLLQLQKVVDF